MGWKGGFQSASPGGSSPALVARIRQATKGMPTRRRPSVIVRSSAERRNSRRFVQSTVTPNGQERGKRGEPDGAEPDVGEEQNDGEVGEKHRNDRAERFPRTHVEAVERDEEHREEQEIGGADVREVLRESVRGLGGGRVLDREARNPVRDGLEVDRRGRAPEGRGSRVPPARRRARRRRARGTRRWAGACCGPATGRRAPPRRRGTRRRDRTARSRRERPSPPVPPPRRRVRASRCAGPRPRRRGRSPDRDPIGAPHPRTARGSEAP